MVKSRQQPVDFFGFLFVSAFVFITVAFVLFIFLAATRHEERHRRHEEEVRAATLSESAFGKTIVHDGHWWVEWFGTDGVTHHPDCPCFKKQAEGN